MRGRPWRNATESVKQIELQINERKRTHAYFDFGNDHVNDAADDCDEVEHIPRIFEVVLRNQTVFGET